MGAVCQFAVTTETLDGVVTPLTAAPAEGEDDPPPPPQAESVAMTSARRAMEDFDMMWFPVRRIEFELSGFRL